MIGSLPEAYRDDVASYVYFGRAPKSDLVRYVIEDNLWEAMQLVSGSKFRPAALSDLRAVTIYFASEAPSGCAGGREVANEWRRAGGLIGQEGDAA